MSSSLLSKQPPPEAITHLAVRRGGASGPPQAHAQQAMLEALCGHFGVAAAAVGGNHFYHDFGSFRLKWECHAEFATYTVTAPLALAVHEAFGHMPLAFLPAVWLARLEGRLMAAAHVVLVMADADAGGLPGVFERSLLAGSSVMQGAELWTDFAKKLVLDNGYRFSASRACFGIVRARIADSNDLLRTRVGIVQELQNRRILESMNARAASQGASSWGPISPSSRTPVRTMVVRSSFSMMASRRSTPAWPPVASA